MRQGLSLSGEKALDSDRRTRYDSVGAWVAPQPTCGSQGDPGFPAGVIFFSAPQAYVQHAPSSRYGPTAVESSDILLARRLLVAIIHGMNQPVNPTRMDEPDRTAVYLTGPIVARVREVARVDERSIRAMVTILCREALDARERAGAAKVQT